MTSTAETHYNLESTEQNEVRQSFERFDSQLKIFSEHIPEIDARPEIKEAGKSLIEEFKLKPSLFEDEGRALVFTAIASRCADSEKMDSATALEEKTFSADALALLAYDHSDALTDAKTIIEHENTLFDDETRKLVYERYTDVNLTKQLKDAIDNDGILDEVKERLGITDDNEDEYELRVLSIGSEVQNYGLQEAAIDYSQIDYTDPAHRDKVDQNSRDRKVLESWKQGLIERNKQFASELGADGRQFEAWVTVIDGVQNLCISMPTAEKILDPTITENNAAYSERDRENTIAVLEHEYTHTQGGLNVDKEVHFGINLEELRAELFSGNKLGYMDIKGLFRDYELVTGHNVTEDMKKLPKGGSTSDIYGLIANNVGLSNMLSVIAASPGTYIDEQSNRFSRGLHEHVGGIDGVLTALLDTQAATGKAGEVEERFDRTASRLVEIVSQPGYTLDIDTVGDYRKRMGSHTVTDLLIERAKEIQKKTASN